MNPTGQNEENVVQSSTSDVAPEQTIPSEPQAEHLIVDGRRNITEERNLDQMGQSKKVPKRIRKPRVVAISPRHVKLLEEIIKPEHRTMKSVMLAAGYSPRGGAHTPSGPLNTKGFQTLMASVIPDTKLVQRHNELLDKRDYRKIENKDGTVDWVDDGPDVQAVSKALEMAYKIRGRFNDQDKAKVTEVKTYNLFYNPTVQQNMKAFEEQLKKSIAYESARKDKEIIDVEAREAGDAEANGTAG